MNDWKSKAEKLFFISKLKINDVARELGMSRKAVSAHLKSCDGFAEEKERRKKENASKRKDYKSKWDKSYRNKPGSVERAMLKRQHEIDVRVLSYERCF